MRLLLYDAKFFYHQCYYEDLAKKGVELKRLFAPSEVDKVNLSEFRGMIAHPGMQNQRDFFERISKYPNLKVAIVSNEPGVYDTDSLDFSVFNIEHIDRIYQYFNNNSHSPIERVKIPKTF